VINKFPSVWEKCQNTAGGGGDSHCRPSNHYHVLSIEEKLFLQAISNCTESLDNSNPSEKKDVLG